jgi:hypothetical protein
MSKIVWETGPLGYPASPGWAYWTPQCGIGSWRAWYFPPGFVALGQLLGDDLPSQEEAAALCQKHADQQESSDEMHETC